MVEHGDGGALSACDPIRRDAVDRVQPLEFVGPLRSNRLRSFIALISSPVCATRCSVRWNREAGHPLGHGWRIVHPRHGGGWAGAGSNRRVRSTGQRRPGVLCAGRGRRASSRSAHQCRQPHRAAGSTRVPQHLPEFIQIAAAVVAETFVKSIEGAQTGRIDIVEEPVPGFVAGRERARRPSAKLRRPVAASAPEGPEAPSAGGIGSDSAFQTNALAAIPIRSGKRLTRHSQTLLIPMGQIAGCLGEPECARFCSGLVRRGVCRRTSANAPRRRKAGFPQIGCPKLRPELRLAASAFDATRSRCRSNPNGVSAGQSLFPAGGGCGIRTREGC